MKFEIFYLLLACISIINADPWGDYKKKFGKKFKNKYDENRRYKYNLRLYIYSKILNLHFEFKDMKFLIRT